MAEENTTFAVRRYRDELARRSLHRAAFPNPQHRIKAGAVGFGDGDHSMRAPSLRGRAPGVNRRRCRCCDVRIYGRAARRRRSLQ